MPRTSNMRRTAGKIERFRTDARDGRERKFVTSEVGNRLRRFVALLLLHDCGDLGFMEAPGAGAPA